MGKLRKLTHNIWLAMMKEAFKTYFNKIADQLATQTL